MGSWQNGNPTSMTRVDAPHEAPELARGYAADEPAPAAALVPDEPLSEQISLQASQLAMHLRGRQEALDHREAELNSRIARFESEAQGCPAVDRGARGRLAFAVKRRATERDLAARCGGNLQSTKRSWLGESKSCRSGKRSLDSKSGTWSGDWLAWPRSRRANSAREADSNAEELGRVAEALESRRLQIKQAERRLGDSQAELQRLDTELAARRCDFEEEVERRARANRPPSTAR